MICEPCRRAGKGHRHLAPHNPNLCQCVDGETAIMEESDSFTVRMRDAMDEGRERMGEYTGTDKSAWPKPIRKPWGIP